MAKSAKDRGSCLSVTLCAQRQRQVDSLREDHSLAVWRLGAEIAARLPRIELQIHDLAVDQLEEACQHILADPPRLLGISCTVWSLRNLERLAARVKRAHPDVIVVAGGPAAPHFLGPDADETVPVDCVVRGDGELALVEIIQALDGGELHDLARIPGLFLRGDGGFQDTGARPALMDLDQLASPYVSELLRPSQRMLIEGARGCPHSCAFCSTPTHQGRVVRRFGRDYLTADFERAMVQGVGTAFFIEPTINLGTGRLSELRDIMCAVDPDGELGLFVEMDPDLVNEAQLRILGDFPSALTFGVGIQSMIPEVLRQVQRHPHTANLEGKLRALADVGKVMVQIMLGLPGDTPDDFLRTLDFVLGLPVDVAVYRTIIAPGTELWSRSSELGLSYDVNSFVLNSSPRFSASELGRLEEESIAELRSAAPTGAGRVTYYFACDTVIRQFGI